MVASHIYLLGYRGCGKSTVGRLLAGRCNCPLLDTDDSVEQAAGASIRDIFEREGEAGFREFEHQVLATAAAEPTPHVIALGGGAILRDDNRRLIRDSGRRIWLQGSAPLLYQRILEDATSQARRPNLSVRGGYEEVVALLAAREPLYSELAEITVNTDHKSPDDIVAEIVDWLESNARIA